MRKPARIGAVGLVMVPLVLAAIVGVGKIGSNWDSNCAESDLPDPRDALPNSVTPRDRGSYYTRS